MSGESSIDHSDAFLDLILGPDFCPQFDIHIGVNTSVNSLSTDFSFYSDPLEINMEEELEKFFKPDKLESEINIDEQYDLNFEMENLCEGYSNELAVRGQGVNNDIRENEVERENDEQRWHFNVEEEHSYSLSPGNYVRHIQPMPDVTSPLVTKSKMIKISNPNYSTNTRRMEQEITYMGRKIIPIQEKKCWRGVPKSTLLHAEPLAGQIQGIKRFNQHRLSLQPQHHAHNSSRNSRLSPRVNLTKNVLSRYKFNRGVSILKKRLPPIKPKLNIMAAEVFQRHSYEGDQHIVEECKSWVSKEDPVKLMKNEQERRRRGKLAMYREKLRNMLPGARGSDKMATINILEMARDYCLYLQHTVTETDSDLQVEENWNSYLKRRLKELEVLPEKVTGSVEKIAVDKFFESFEF